jgi:hypothetical protein
LLTGCSKDNNDDNGNDDNTTITINDDQKQQDLYADDTSDGVSFTTKGAWTSAITEKDATRAATPTWISISPDHGDAAGNYTISITLETNLTGADRTAIITIVCGDSRIDISVTQKGKTESGETPKTYYLVTKIVDVKDGDTYDFEYDDQYRLIASTNNSTSTDKKTVATFIYKGNTITVKTNVTATYDGKTFEEEEEEKFTVNSKGYIDSHGGTPVTYYANDYLKGRDYSPSEAIEEATWTDGNLVKVVDYAGRDGGESTITYGNAEWVNNPNINMDLNWVFTQSEWLDCFITDGESRFLKAMDYMGKRSKNYMTEEHETNTTTFNKWFYYHTFKFDENGIPNEVFIKTVTQHDDGSFGSIHEDAYAITYKVVAAPKK